MTDDSPSRDPEGEASPDEDGRASDPEEAPRERGDDPSHEPRAETPGEPGEEPPTDELDATDDPITNEGNDPIANESDEPGTDDDSPASDSSREQPTVAGNPMAGVEPDGTNTDSDGTGSDDPDAGDAPDETTSDEPTPGGATADAPAPEGVAPDGEVVGEDETPSSPTDFVPEDVRKYERFKKMDGARYERVNEFLRDRTYVTAREWAIARLCADFRTETGVEMTKIGENLPRLVPFMNDTYTPQAVNQARHSFEEKVRKSGATFLYGAMSGFFTAEQLDDLMYEITEVAKFLLEVEGVDLSVEEELEAEDRILSVMREVREQSEQLRHEGVTCPECGHDIGAEGDD